LVLFTTAAHGQPDAFSQYGRYDLDALVSKEGQARVIVGVAVPAVPEGLPPADTRQARRDAINELQNRLLHRTAGPGLKERKRFTELPFVTLEVNAQGLARILTDPDVISVEEDRRLELHLFDTPGIVRANLAWAAGYRGEGQTLAILDTGVDTSHPFFTGKVADEACFSTPGSGFVSLCPNGQPTQFGPGAGTFCPDLSLGC
jgi:subtilisin family serine protease